MPEFRIDWAEITHYTAVVSTDTEEEARELFHDGDVQHDSSYDNGRYGSITVTEVGPDA